MRDVAAAAGGVSLMTGAAAAARDRKAGRLSRWPRGPVR